MKMQELRELSDSDLLDKLAEEQTGLSKLRFNHSVSSLESPMQIRNRRRNVARILTEINLRHQNKNNA